MYFFTDFYHVTCVSFAVRILKKNLDAMSSPSKPNSLSINAKKSAMKETVDLLRIQAKMQRMKVSRSAEEIMNYCLENARDDWLLQGIPTGGNPYKEGKNCPVM